MSHLTIHWLLLRGFFITHCLSPEYYMLRLPCGTPLFCPMYMIIAHTQTRPVKWLMVKIYNVWWQGKFNRQKKKNILFTSVSNSYTSRSMRWRGRYHVPELTLQTATVVWISNLFHNDMIILNRKTAFRDRWAEKWRKFFVFRSFFAMRVICLMRTKKLLSEIN
jgi:hypothetical protein